MPEYFLNVLDLCRKSTPLVTPAIEHSVGLVVVDRDPVSPMVLAVFDSAKAIDALAVSSRKRQ